MKLLILLALFGLVGAQYLFPHADKYKTYKGLFGSYGLDYAKKNPYDYPPYKLPKTYMKIPNYDRFPGSPLQPTIEERLYFKSLNDLKYLMEDITRFVSNPHNIPMLPVAERLLKGAARGLKAYRGGFHHPSSYPATPADQFAEYVPHPSFPFPPKAIPSTPALTPATYHGDYSELIQKILQLNLRLVEVLKKHHAYDHIKAFLAARKYYGLRPLKFDFSPKAFLELNNHLELAARKYLTPLKQYYYKAAQQYQKYQKSSRGYGFPRGFVSTSEQAALGKYIQSFYKAVSAILDATGANQAFNEFYYFLLGKNINPKQYAKKIIGDIQKVVKPY